MPEPQTPSSRPRVLSGMRPTGKLHLGNYMGALANWVKLQNETSTTATSSSPTGTPSPPTTPTPRRSRRTRSKCSLDYLAAGLDPERSVLFLQSRVLQHSELSLLLGMITPLGWLERVPSYKEMQENLSSKDLTTYGFLGYPVLMAADILLYQPDFVPVGQDQQAHVELTREIARRFNQFYKLGEREVLPEPKVLLTPSPKLPGTDGRKMSKSYGNTILHERSRAGGPKEAQDHGHRPGPHPPHRQGRSRQVPRRRPAQGIFHARDNGQGLRGLPFGGHRLHRVQEVGRPTRWSRCSIPSSSAAPAITETQAIEILNEGSRRAQARAEQTMIEVREAMQMKWTTVAGA